MARTRLVLAASATALAALASLTAALPSQATPAAAHTPRVSHVITAASCPGSAPDIALQDGSDQVGVYELCRHAVATAATPQARLALKAIFHMLGAPYACNGVGRMAPFRFDCSSLVSRAYYLGAGIDTAGPDWASSTQDMVPWGGSPLADWASYVAPSDLRPGDLVLYNTGGATYRHVAMYIGNGWMIHTGYCGDVAHVSQFWGFNAGGNRTFLVARRVIRPGDHRVPDPRPGSVSTTRRPTSGASNSVAAYPGGGLRLGMRGAAVASLQRALIRRGYSIPAVQNGSVPFGGFGHQTYDAVAGFQADNGMFGSARGTVNRRLYSAITGWHGTAAPSRSSNSASSSGRLPVVSLGALRSGDSAAVATVQAALNRVIHAGLPVSGHWGARTQAAFDSFRRDVLGMNAANATGAPGVSSLRGLGRRAGFVVAW